MREKGSVELLALPEQKRQGGRGYAGGHGMRSDGLFQREPASATSETAEEQAELGGGCC